MICGSFFKSNPLYLMNMPKVQTLLPKRNTDSDDLKMQKPPQAGGSYRYFLNHQ